MLFDFLFFTDISVGLPAPYHASLSGNAQEIPLGRTSGQQLLHALGLQPVASALSGILHPVRIRGRSSAFISDAEEKRGSEGRGETGEEGC